MEYLQNNSGNRNGDLKKNRYTGLFIIISLSLLAVFCMDILFGSVNIGISEVIKGIFAGSDHDVNTIVLKFRIPKALTAVMAGIALSVSGLQMQTVFRNPMAGPYVLGISSGASLGVAFVILGFSAQLAPESFRGRFLAQYRSCK